VLLIDAQHRASLVVLIGVGTADPHGQVEVAVNYLAIDVAVVVDRGVAAARYGQVHGFDRETERVPH
jgi:hypothetical protein